jgi:hypothetical protein
MADEYPKAKYHATLPPSLVNNVEEETELGKDWHDFPDLSDRPTSKREEAVSVMKQMIGQADRDLKANRDLKAKE